MASSFTNKIVYDTREGWTIEQGLEYFTSENAYMKVNLDVSGEKSGKIIAQGSSVKHFSTSHSDHLWIINEIVLNYQNPVWYNLKNHTGQFVMAKQLQHWKNVILYFRRYLPCNDRWAYKNRCTLKSIFSELQMKDCVVLYLHYAMA